MSVAHHRQNPIESFYSDKTYFHVSGVPWRIITGFGFDDWVYWNLLLQTLLLTITCNSSHHCLRLSPFLTGLRVSSLLLWLELVPIYESTTLYLVVVTTCKSNFQSETRLWSRIHVTVLCLPLMVKVSIFYTIFFWWWLKVRGCFNVIAV
jgi:hypothetical protein